jgi:hypothetical protein
VNVVSVKVTCPAVAVMTWVEMSNTDVGASVWSKAANTNTRFRFRTVML